MKYQKYDKYKISNNPWFSELPENWDVSRIKFNSVLFGRIGYRGYSTDDLVDEKEGAVTLSPSNMINGKLDFSKCTYLSWDKYNESPEIKMRDHDVVMVKTGSTIGKVSFAEKIEYPTTINPQLVLYKKIKCNPKFLFYYLFSKNAQDRIPLYNSGSTIPTMKQEDIGRFYLPIPSLNEQNSIVEFLDRETTHIDTLIEKKERLINLLKEKRTALITQAVTKGLNPNVKMKDSGIEWCDIFPADWNVISLKWISKIYAGGTPDKSVEAYWENGTIPWINSGTVNQKYITKYSELITEDAYKSSSAKWIPKGSLVMALAGQGKTKGMVAYLEIDTTCNQSMAAIIPRKDIYSKYLMYWLEINYNNIRNLGGGDARDGINLEMIGTIKCPVPSLKEQKEIAEIIEKETKRIEILLDKIVIAIQKHREYRTAIISAAVTGKIKVTQD